MSAPVPVCIWTFIRDCEGKRTPPHVPVPICMTCITAGCCCEWCQTCGQDVNPWQHFTSAHRDVSLIRHGHQGIADGVLDQNGEAAA